MNRKDFIYDLEVYPNFFSFSAVYRTKSKKVQYEISDRKNQVDDLLEFLRNCVRTECRLVGFNNVGFDYPILHFIIEKSRKSIKEGKPLKVTAGQIYKKMLEMFENKKDDRFGSKIKDDEVVIPQVDLYLINHFDNKARSTSLKMLEFNMRSNNIQELPVPAGTVLTPAQMDIVLDYNMHDVMETLKFYNYCDEALTLREELTKLFGFDCTNFNDTKIGKQLFINSLEEAKPGSCYIQTEHGRKMNQTKREFIRIKECIFPYVQFERPEFKAVHEWFTKQVITETKGVFSDIEEHRLGELAKYATMVEKRKKFKGKPSEEELLQFKKEYPMGWITEEELKATEYAFDNEGNHIMEEVINEETGKVRTRKKRIPKISYWGCWNLAETLNVVIDGFQYDFGVGGIHGAKQGTHRSTENRKLLTYDVASYYPNMAISNRIYPKHLGETFCDVYSKLYQMRKEQPKGSPANSALKLALNGTYGDSNNEYSPLYDPAYTMAITIGGQLSLCMLIEKLINHCNAEIIMANTDGFEFFVDVDKVEKAKEYVKWWEETTGLQMEGDVYSVMFVRDVNSYIAIKG